MVRGVTTLASHWPRQARQPALGHRDQSDSQGRATASCPASSLVSNTRMLAADWTIVSPPPALTGRHYSLIPKLASHNSTPAAPAPAGCNILHRHVWSSRMSQPFPATLRLASCIPRHPAELLLSGDITKCINIQWVNPAVFRSCISGSTDAMCQYVDQNYSVCIFKMTMVLWLCCVCLRLSPPLS